MEPLRMLYFVTLIFMFKVKHFLVMKLVIKIAQASDGPGQICLDSQGRRCGVALVSCASERQFIIERSLQPIYQTIGFINYAAYTFTVCCNRTAHNQNSLPSGVDVREISSTAFIAEMQT